MMITESGKMEFDADILDKAMDLALQLGANYADLRLETSVGESAEAESGDIKDVSLGSGTALGVRALAGGTWGFASDEISDTSDIWEVVSSCVEKGVKAAKAVSRFGSIELAQSPPVVDNIVHSFKVPPPSIEEKQAYVTDLSKEIAQMPNIKLAIQSLGHSDSTKYFANTEGARIVEDVMLILGSSYIMASEGDQTQTLWFPTGARGGWEDFQARDPLDQTREMAKIASELVTTAITPKTQTSKVVTRPDFNSLLVHEIVGHPVEGDRILGGEAAWAGRAWWKEMSGQKVGSDLVNAVSDARPNKMHRGLYGTFPYDDEGVPASRVVHIENGMLKNFLHSRHSASISNASPSGAMRAISASMMPIIRMTNTYFEANPEGPNTESEFLEDIKDGVLMGHQSIPSIGSRRYRFQVAAYNGWEIKDGERGRMLKNISIMGTTPNYLDSISKVGGPGTFQLHQIPNCGKGDPMQIARVGNGGPLMEGELLVVGGV